MYCLLLPMEDACYQLESCARREGGRQVSRLTPQPPASVIFDVRFWTMTNFTPSTSSLQGNILLEFYGIDLVLFYGQPVVRWLFNRSFDDVPVSPWSVNKWRKQNWQNFETPTYPVSTVRVSEDAHLPYHRGQENSDLPLYLQLVAAKNRNSRPRRNDPNPARQGRAIIFEPKFLQN